MPDATPVLVFDLYRPVWIYHRSGGLTPGGFKAIPVQRYHEVLPQSAPQGTKWGDKFVRVISRTGCGLPTYLVFVDEHGEPLGSRTETHAVHVRRDHAKAIGRPCKRCYLH